MDTLQASIVKYKYKKIVRRNIFLAILFFAAIFLMGIGGN